MNNFPFRWIPDDAESNLWWSSNYDWIIEYAAASLSKRSADDVAIAAKSTHFKINWHVLFGYSIIEYIRTQCHEHTLKCCCIDFQRNHASFTNAQPTRNHFRLTLRRLHWNIRREYNLIVFCVELPFIRAEIYERRERMVFGDVDKQTSNIDWIKYFYFNKFKNEHIHMRLHTTYIYGVVVCVWDASLSSLSPQLPFYSASFRSMHIMKFGIFDFR